MKCAEVAKRVYEIREKKYRKINDVSDDLRFRLYKTWDAKNIVDQIQYEIFHKTECGQIKIISGSKGQCKGGKRYGKFLLSINRYLICEKKPK